MHRFRKILYVTLGHEDESAALSLALKTAHKNRAPLEILACLPEFPTDLESYREPFEQSVLEHLRSSVARTCQEMDLDIAGESITYEIESGMTPGLRIIRHVLGNQHNLVVKDAEPSEGGRGFEAIDMELLRKCPCAVWLCRPDQEKRKHPRIAVAIDPESPTPAGEALALRLLELSSSLAERLEAELNVISCWDYEFERPLRASVWYRIPEAELQRAMGHSRSRLRASLDDLVRRAGLAPDVPVHHPHGQPENAIPTFVERNGVDILVMGTVARTGVPGFLIGNTAENVLQKVSCSLLALKPEGFVCPVRIDS